MKTPEEIKMKIHTLELEYKDILTEYEKAIFDDEKNILALLGMEKKLRMQDLKWVLSE